VPVATALKVAVYLALQEADIGTSERARRLGVHEAFIYRRRGACSTRATGSKAETLKPALLAVGQRLAVEVRAAA
jgi:hypothetical protein